MSKSHKQQIVDVAVSGGVKLPDELDGFGTASHDNVPDDDIGRQLYTLQLLHPDVQIKFRQEDISSMDEATKILLIEDFKRILSIEPLQSTVK